MMTQLRQRMLEGLQRRNDPARTIQLYLPHVADSPNIFIALRPALSREYSSVPTVSDPAEGAWHDRATTRSLALYLLLLCQDLEACISAG